MGDRFETFGLVVAGIAVIAVAWEAGIIGFLVQAAGGTAVVLTSVVISEILYLATAKHYSLEGFVMAAIDGYLFALTFRFGGWAGRGIALRIGRATMPRIVGGWVAERFAVGVVGGSLGGGAVVFAHGIAETLLHQGNFPTLGQFVRGMTMGALFGLFGEFVLGPALQGAFRVGGQTVLNTVEDAARVIRESGTSPTRYAAEIARALSAIREHLATFLEESSVRSILEGLRERMATIGESLEGLPSAARQRFRFAMLRRIFELSDIGLGAMETDGLERLLTSTEAGAARLSEQELVAFLNRLVGDKARAQLVLNVLGRLTDEGASALVAAGQLDALAAAPRLLQRLSGAESGRAWAVLAGSSFRLSVGDFEVFLDRIAHYPEPQQISGLDALRRPGQLLTPEGIAIALEKGGLGEGIIQGLDRLYGALESAAADGVMRMVPPGNLGAYLRYLGSLRQELVNELAQAGYLEPLANAPRVVDHLAAGGLEAMRALTRPHGPFGANIGEAIAAFNTFLEALQNVSQQQRELAFALLRREGNRVPPDAVLTVLRIGVELDNEVERSLDHIYRDGLITVERLRQLTGPRFEEVLRGLFRTDIPTWSDLGQVEAILRNDEVIAVLRNNINVHPFRTFFRRYPGHEGAAIDALGRLLSRVRALNGGNLRPFEATDLLTALAARHPTPIADIDQIALDIGQPGFPTRTAGPATRPTLFPSAAEEARAFVRLLGDNVVPPQAQTMLSLPTDVAVERAEVAGEGAIGPDVLFTTPTGESIGREAVATAIPTVDPANPLAALRTNLSGASLARKVDAYQAGGVYGARPSIRWLRREIDVRIDPAVDGFSYDDLLRRMQADGSLATFLDDSVRRIPGFNIIDRIRFYDSHGSLVHTWTL
jgi:hypothetical protein